MTAAHGKAAIRRFIDGVWNGGELDLVDELVCADYVGHHGRRSDQTRGREGLRRRVSEVRSAYPDLEVRIDDELAEEDRVVTRWTATASRREWHGVSVFRMLAGRQVESWTYWTEPR
jgi:predicted SnoaL-like aldol condensation-catalyzing enzyme